KFSVVGFEFKKRRKKEKGRRDPSARPPRRAPSGWASFTGCPVESSTSKKRKKRRINAEFAEDAENAEEEKSEKRGKRLTTEGTEGKRAEEEKTREGSCANMGRVNRSWRKVQGRGLRRASPRLFLAPAHTSSSATCAGPWRPAIPASAHPPASPHASATGVARDNQRWRRAA